MPNPFKDDLPEGLEAATAEGNRFGVIGAKSARLLGTWPSSIL